MTVVDASALAAVLFKEPGFERIAARLRGESIAAPHLLKYELANVAWLKVRRHPGQASTIHARLESALDERSGIHWYDVNAAEVALMALATGLSAYDASYLWLAASLEADLVTLDTSIMAAGRDENVRPD